MEVGVQGVRGGREELVRVRPLLWVECWGLGVCRSGTVLLCFLSLSLNDEPEVAAVCIYPAGRGLSSSSSRAGEGGGE